MTFMAPDERPDAGEDVSIIWDLRLDTSACRMHEQMVAKTPELASGAMLSCNVFMRFTLCDFACSYFVRK